jgi:hypothetical protein
MAASRSKTIVDYSEVSVFRGCLFRASGSGQETVCDHRKQPADHGNTLHKRTRLMARTTHRNPPIGQIPGMVTWKIPRIVCHCASNGCRRLPGPSPGFPLIRILRNNLAIRLDLHQGPASNSLTPTKFLIGQFMLTLFLILISFWIATQWTAGALGFQPRLGPPVANINGYAIYLRHGAFSNGGMPMMPMRRIHFAKGGIIASLGVVSQVS